MIRTAFDLAAAEVWALAPDRLELLQRIADRDLDSADMAALRLRLGIPTDWAPKAVATREGQAVDSAHPGVEMRGDVAVIPLAGTMFRHASLFTEFSGGTATGLFAKAVQQAADDSAVRAILLSVDSPGGEANGVNEVAKLLHSIRGAKPIKAYAGGLCASGAYWLSAATDEIIVDDTALLGSVGVVTQVTKRAERDGVKTFEIVSSQSPMKRPDVETDEGLAVIRGRVDAMAQVFIDAVASYRGVSAEHVIASFGRGHVLVGQQAVDAKAANRIGTLEGLIAELNASSRPTFSLPGRPAGPSTPGAIMSGQQQTGDSVPVASITAAYIDEKHPQVAAALRADGHAKGLQEGRADGAKAERERIQGLEEAAMPGHDDLLAKAKADGKSTSSDLALSIIKAEKAKGKDHLDALAADSRDVPKIDPPAGGGDGGKPPAKTGPIDERAKAEWDKDGDLRAEFGDDFAAYLAIRKREDAGREKARR